MSEQYYERREFDNGQSNFVPVAQLIPGQAYYAQRLNPEDNAPYYVQIQVMPQTVVQPYPITTYAPPAMPTLIYPTATTTVNVTNTAVQPPPDGATFSAQEKREANDLHLGINITCIFFPGLIYLIGWPFVWHRLNKFAERTSDSSIKLAMNAINGVGWTGYVFHLITLVVFCTFWIPSCTLVTGNYYSYYYSGDYYYCSETLAGTISVAVFPLLTFIFQVTITKLGSRFINSLPSH